MDCEDDFYCSVYALHHLLELWRVFASQAMNIQCNYSYDPQCWVSVAPWEQVSLAFEASAWALFLFLNYLIQGICLLLLAIFFLLLFFAMFNFQVYICNIWHVYLRSGN